MSTDLDALPELDPFDPDTQAGMHELVARLHADGHWVVRTPMWLQVITYGDARDLWKDGRFTTPRQRMLELQGITDGLLYDRCARNILALEGDDHSRIRRLVSPAFTPRSIDRLRPMMRDYLEARVAEVGPAGRCELVADVATAYPIAVICEIVGAPPEDWPLFSRLADSIMKQVGFTAAEDLAEIEAALVELEGYVEDLVAERRRQPTDDLLSELVVTADADGDRLSVEELRDLVTSILLGGTDTTRNQLGLAVLHLARHPDQWERLGRDPTAVPAAVEEVLRFDPTAAGTMRIAREDVVHRGITIPAGAAVLLSASAANRDPAVVACPHALDTGADRAGWTPLSFGAGRHYCLGANLARAELQEALTVLPARLRNLRLDGEPVMKPVMGIYGPASLPLAFDPTP